MGQLAVFQFRPARATFFDPDGTLVSETPLPPLFHADMLLGNRLLGMKLALLDRENTRGMPSYLPMEVHAFSGEVTWERADLADAVGLDCFDDVLGIPTPDGGFVYRACKHQLAFLDAKDAATAKVVASPAYVEAFPNERAVAAHLDAMADIGGRGGSLSEAQREGYAAEFRANPKDWFLEPGTFNFDAQNRLWVATTADRDAFSYLDVWMGSEYAGTVRIRDRLMSYDILGSTLAAVVEEAPDQSGVAPRAIHWYDIGELPFGVEGGS